MTTYRQQLYSDNQSLTYTLGAPVFYLPRSYKHPISSYNSIPKSLQHIDMGEPQSRVCCGNLVNERSGDLVWSPTKPIGFRRFCRFQVLGIYPASNSNGILTGKNRTGSKRSSMSKSM